MKHFCLLPFTLCLFLTACGEGQNARDIIGLGRKTPDEFRVVARPPLSVPPDFALRPPAEGADIPDLPPADLAARAMVTGSHEETLAGENAAASDTETAIGTVRSYDLESQADEGFLANIGAGDADERIRAKLDREQLQRESAVQKELDSSFGWLTPPKNDAATIVDAEKEKERLKENLETGKDITDGETPVIEPKTPGPLEGLF